MAQELVRRIWCDQHQQAKEEDVEADTYLVSIEGTQTEVDLCQDCAQPLVELRAFLELYGRPQVKRGKKAAATSPAEDERMPCPVCQKSYKNRSSLAAHFRQTHDTSLADWEAQHADGDISCATCGRVFSSLQGLGRHRTTQGH